MSVSYFVRYDISTADIGAALRLMVGGNQEVTRFRDPVVNEEYDVQLWLEEKYRGDPRVIERLYVSRDNGDLMRLDSDQNQAQTTKTTFELVRIGDLDDEKTCLDVRDELEEIPHDGSTITCRD